MNNSEEQVRLCKKCGKRLPSSNNFCMYCGYNNNLNDEELEALKSINSNNIHTQNKQELLNKSIAAKERELVIGGKSSTKNVDVSSEKTEVKVRPENVKNSLQTNLLYVFILLDIIFISVLFTFKSNNLLYEVFMYNLDKYDKVINIDNDSFLVLKNKKVTLLGDNSSFDKDLLKEITDKKVVALEVDDDYSNKYYLETDKKLYSFYGYSDELLDLEIEKTTGNIYKDVSVYYNNYSEDNEYHKILRSTYYIKDGSLYKYVSEGYKKIDNTENKVNVKKYARYYSSDLVLDKYDLGIKNPEIIYSSNYNDSLIIKGDDIIKVYTDGELIQSINKVTYEDITYNISDFKYILFSDFRFLFVCKNGKMINYRYDTDYLSQAERESNVRKFANKHQDELNKNVVVKDGLSFEESDSYSNLVKEDIKQNLGKIILYVTIIIAMILILIGVMYFIREFNFIKSSLIAAGVLTVFYIIISIYLFFKLNKKIDDIDDIIKSSIDYFLICIASGVLIAQIKEIVRYVSFKFNIETIYHFFLLFIGISSTLIAIGLLTGKLLVAILLPGLIWAFLCSNDENYEEYDYNIKRLVNSKTNKFIIYETYISPNQEHDNRLSLLIEKLLLLKRRYNNLRLVLFGDLNINLDDIDIKLKNKIEQFGFKVWFKKKNIQEYK